MYFPDLVEEYKQSLKELRAAGGCPSMERDMLEAIKWMETGYDPAEYRAATRQDAYAMDHHLMQDLIGYVDSSDDMPAHLQSMKDMLFNKYEEDNCRWRFGMSLYNEVERMQCIKKRINYTLEGLTENERVAFIMIRAERISFGKTAKILGIGKSTVQGYLKRAELKIKNNIRKSK